VTGIAHRRSSRRSVGLALAATITATLPVSLTGALGVSLRDDLGISVGHLGIAVSTYFGVSAICSPGLGRLGQRLGPRAAVRIGVGIAAVAMLGVGTVAGSFAALVACLAIGGVANALTQPSVNDFLAGVTEPERLAIAFGIKQASVPAAVVISGLAVPSLADLLGWRAVYIAGVCVAAVVIAIFGGVSRVAAIPAVEQPLARREVRFLVLLAVAAGLAAMGGNALSAFLVSSGVDSGLSEQAAGLLLAAGSITCVLVRVAAGQATVRWKSDGVRPFAAMLAVGTVGYLALAAGPVVLFVLGSLVAFSGGWGWAGLFQYVVVSRNRHAAAKATGMTQTAVYIGAAIGPLLFGVVATHSYHAAWAVMAAAAAASALVATVARYVAIKPSEEVSHSVRTDAKLVRERGS
jgi:MFS family permease